MDGQALSSLRRAAGFFSAHIFCLAATDPLRTFARHFASPPDVFEDPFTGSATGGMAALLWQNGAIDSNRLVAGQGDWMQRPGKANVEVFGSRYDVTAVRVGGAAVTVLRGELVL